MTEDVEIRTPGTIVAELSAAVAIAMVKKLIDDGLLHGRPPTTMGDVLSRHGSALWDDTSIAGLVYQNAGWKFLTKEEYGEKIAELSNELDRCLKLLYAERDNGENE